MAKATSSSDCGNNGYCVWEFSVDSGRFELLKNKAASGFACESRPPGDANLIPHGFIVLSDTAIFSYKCDNFYNQASERGIIYNDSKINIDWKLADNELIISEKDLILPNLDNADLC